MILSIFWRNLKLSFIILGGAEAIMVLQNAFLIFLTIHIPGAEELLLLGFKGDARFFPNVKTT